MRNDDVYYDETVQHTWLAMRQHAEGMAGLSIPPSILGPHNVIEGGEWDPNWDKPQ